jgi:hypothetical protein
LGCVECLDHGHKIRRGPRAGNFDEAVLSGSFLGLG